MLEKGFTKLLKSNFKGFLDVFNHHCPFTKYGQLEYHIETIRLLREFGSPEAGLNSNDFMKSLYRTIKAWGMGSRGSKLKQFPIFVDNLQAISKNIKDFNEITIDHPNLKVSIISDELTSLLQDLNIVENGPRITAGSFVLHHLLPDLVVPINWEHTRLFFGWGDSFFQNYPEKCFIEAFHSFVDIARTVNPLQYVKNGWHSSRTKVMDNAVIGLIQVQNQELSI